MAAHLAQSRGGWRDALDLLRGAHDARMNPQWPGRRTAWRLPLTAAVLALLSGVLAVQLNARLALVLHSFDHSTQLLWNLAGATIVGDEVLIGLALTAAFVIAAALGWLAGSRLVAWLAGLLALRFLVEYVVLFVLLNYADETFLAAAWRYGWMPVGLLINLFDLALWALVAVVVLRRAGLPWPLGLAIGCVLELVLGSMDLSAAAALTRSPWFYSAVTSLGPSGKGSAGISVWLGQLLPQVQVLRLTLWAAVLAALVARRRRFGEPPEGAAVPAHPLPDTPPIATARIDS
jgi:hypothetical protein